MGFFQEARRAGAQEYGAKRAEKYGRQERALAGLKLVLGLVLLGFLIYLYVLGQGGAA